jgi:signal transduction histidine kinase/ActR/RegA family two-component response regulator
MQNDELVQASFAAKEAAEKYSELYDFAPSVFFTLCKKGKIIELNLSGAKMLGKERLYLKNSQFGFFVSRDTKPIFNLFLEKVFTNKVKESCEVILSVNDNPPMYVQLTGSAIKNGEQCFLTIIEITKHKQAEQDLIIANKELAFQDEEKEKRAVELIIANKELIFQNEEKEKRAAELVIANKELVFQNEEKEKRAAELVIANKELVFQNEEKEKRASELIIANKELVFQNEEKEKRASELIIANKELVFQNEEKEKRASELIIANKELVFQNHEKEKRAAELTRSKQILDQTERLGRVGGWEIDLKNNELIWSDIVYQIHETEPDYKPTVGSAINFYSPEARPVIYEALNQAINKGKPFDVDLQLITAKQNRIWVRAIGQAYRDNGEIVKIGGMFQDINERKQAEQELIIAIKELVFQNHEKENRAVELIKAKEHAEESDRLKSAFLANMSHEIRTPMNGILGFADLLREPELTGEEQQEYINIINKSGVRMLNIINDIVDISKIESGLMEVDIKKSNINEQIENIHIFFKPEVERKGMKIFFQNGLPAKEAIIKTDREKIYAILTNLVKNAIKFSDKGAIEFGYNLKMNVSTDSKGSPIETAELEFFVKDTGIGIPKDRQEAIFHRFVQADIADKRASQGAGLGLSITKAYVEMIGGKLWLKSEEGKGSTFYFTIPYNSEPQEKSNTKNIVPDKTENQIKKLKILIAEDDEISEMLITKTVKTFSKEVLKARTGVEAIDVCRINPDIDLIMMDIKMPEMNGYDATRQIRQFNNKVVIIAQTAFVLKGDKEKAIKAGCNEYIPKPIDKMVLRELLQKHFIKSGNKN